MECMSSVHETITPSTLMLPEAHGFGNIYLLTPHVYAVNLESAKFGLSCMCSTAWSHGLSHHSGKSFFALPIAWNKIFAADIMQVINYVTGKHREKVTCMVETGIAGMASLAEVGVLYTSGETVDRWSTYIEGLQHVWKCKAWILPSVGAVNWMELAVAAMILYAWTAHSIINVYNYIVAIFLWPGCRS